MKDYSCNDFRSVDLQILIHHIYEYKKGVRNMVLHTLAKKEQEAAEILLKKRGVCFLVRSVTDKKINIFFGNPECVKIIESFGQKSLNYYTPEQDFMLGIMLGYDRNEQYKRYLSRSKNNNKFEKALEIQGVGEN